MSGTGPDFVAAPGAAPHAEPDDREEIYFQGSPPVRSMAGKLCGYCFITLALLALVGLLIHKQWDPWWLILGLIVVALLMPWVPWILAKTVRYRISNYRIDYERGFLSKNIDTVELWHVEDLHFNQSLFDRMLNVGNITVISKDDKMPTLELHGLPNPRPLYELLKQRVIAVKRQRGVLKMDPG